MPPADAVPLAARVLMEGHQGDVTALVCDPRCPDLIYTAALDKRLRRWDAARALPVRERGVRLCMLWSV